MWEQISFILLGFGIVLGVLVVLWLANAAIGRLFVGRGAAPAAAAQAGPPVAAAQPAAFPGVPPRHVAAIAAAVSEMTGGRGRIVAVTVPPHVSLGWAAEGRHTQMASHRVRWDWAVPGPPHVEHDGTVHDHPAPPRGTA